jgi:hypothetical protein
MKFKDPIGGFGEETLFALTPRFPALPESGSLPSVQWFAECFFGHSAKSFFDEC